MPIVTSRTYAMPLGTELIAELSRRGERGMYFDYPGYRRLRHVDSVAELASFLMETEFSPDIASADPVMVADGLRDALAERESDWDVFAWLACDPFCGILALPFFLMHRAARRLTGTAGH